MDVDILLSKVQEKMKIEDNGCGEDFMSQVSHIRESTVSPQSHGKSQPLQAQHSKISTKNDTSINENTPVCIEKAQAEQKPGYDGYSSFGSQKQGIIEPITIKG